MAWRTHLLRRIGRQSQWGLMDRIRKGRHMRGTLKLTTSGRMTKLLPLLLIASSVACIQAQKFALSKPSASSAKRYREAIPHATLPFAVKSQTYPAQIFELTKDGRPALGLVPMSIDVDNGHMEKPTILRQCGVVFVSPDGKTSYLPVIGPDPKEFSSQCLSVEAVAVLHEGGWAPPRLIYICNALAPSGRNYDMAFILDWGGSPDAYFVDRDTSYWVESQLHHVTVSNVRRVIAAHKR